MGRAPARASEGGLNKGPWTEEEDAILAAFVKANGEGNWRSLPKQAGNAGIVYACLDMKTSRRSMGVVLGCVVADCNICV